MRTRGEEEASNSEKEGQRERREGEMGGKEQLYICACEESVASVFRWHCSKRQSTATFTQHAYLSPSLYKSTTGQWGSLTEGGWGVKLEGWVLLLPHPVQDPKYEKKKERKTRKCCTTQPLPTALAESASPGSPNLS